MKRNALIFGIVVMVMTILFASCGGGSLYGTFVWEGGSETLGFNGYGGLTYTGIGSVNDDGTLSLRTVSGTYSVSGSKVKIKYRLPDGRQTEKTFTLSGDQSSLSGSGGNTYVRGAAAAAAPAQEQPAPLPQAQQQTAQPVQQQTTQPAQQQQAPAQQAAGPAAPESDFTVTLTSDNRGVRITDYKGSASRLVIPATIQGMPVREISINGSSNYATTSIVVPEGVTSFHLYSGFPNLTSVSLPSTLLDLGFHDESWGIVKSTKITSISLPAGLTRFVGLKNLGLTSLPSPWPRGITTLDIIPDTIRGDVIIPEGITIIARSAFSESNITSVTLPSTIREIYPYAFNSCKSLTTVNIPASVRSIVFGQFAFTYSPNINLASQARLREVGYGGEF